MLAQAFKSPADLGLTDRQHRALVLTLGVLERGEVVHVKKVQDLPLLGFGGDFTGHFNMSTWRTRRPCGTVGCFGGTAEMLGGLRSTEITGDNNPALRSLFFPPFYRDDITPAQAAIALRAYLTTGEPCWEHVEGHML